MPAAIDQEAEKLLVATKALEYVSDGMLLGLGSGSTIAKFVPLLGQRVKEGLHIQAVSTSTKTKDLAIAAGIDLLPLDSFDSLDLTIDGADEIDHELRTIKGGGGALLYEKVAAAASKSVLIVVDSKKVVQKLGAFPLPIEVIPYGWKSIAKELEALDCTIKQRTVPNSTVPFLSDERNFILDCQFGLLDDPQTLANHLSAIPGVVCHGIFIGLCSQALVARGNQVELLRR